MKAVINFGKPGRDRGVEGNKNQAVARYKKRLWMESGNWPWWIASDTEAHHWSAKVVGNDVQGGQCDGLSWRHARGKWLQSGHANAQEQLEKYEVPWIRANGEQAIADALFAADPSGLRLRYVEMSDADHGFMCEARSSFDARAAERGWSLLLEKQEQGT